MKKTLIGIAIGLALPFAIPPIRQGFVEGFSGEWKRAFPDGWWNYIKS